MNSPTPMPIRAHPPARVCVCSARPLVARPYTASERAHTCARNDRAHRCTKHARARSYASVRGAACVHGHEDPGSKRSRGPSGSDPSTPARIRHTRTPMLRGRARRCLGGVPGRQVFVFLLFRLFLSFAPSRRFFFTSPPAFLSLFLLLPVPPVLILRPLSSPSPPSPPPASHISSSFFFSSSFLPSLRSARIHVHPRN